MSIQDQIINVVTNFLSVLGIEEAMVGSVIGTFFFLFGELLILFILISFIVALLQIYISKEKIQKALTTKSKLLNSALGALLGSITPFCSCSTIPLLVGLIKSGAPFSGMMSFLLTSPILNPAIIILFVTFFGVAPTIIYAGIAFVFAVIVGYVLDKKDFAKYIKSDNVENFDSTASCCSEVTTKNETACCFEPVLETAGGCCATIQESSCFTETAENSCCDSSKSESSCCSTLSNESSCCDGGVEIQYSDFKGTFIEKNITAIKFAFIDSIKLFKQVLLFLVFGAAIGSFIYGFVPTDLLAQFAGADNIMAVPLASVLGIPMYIRTETMIPIASVLVEKGVGLGTMVALIIGGAGASIPEVSLLGSIFKKQLVITFLICIFSVATLTGYAFNLFL